MAVIFTDAANAVSLKNYLNNVTPESLVLRLYSNNRNPTKSDIASDYTEINGNGYSAVILLPENFIFTSGNTASAAYPQVTFTFTGPAGPVYGYYVTREVSGDLQFANRFSNAPINISNAGDEIPVDITVEFFGPATRPTQVWFG